MTLTLLSYNIHSGVGLDGALDLGRIADVIAASGADLVALQEVDRHRREQSRFEDQPGLLAERLGFHLAYAANLDDEPARPGAPRAQYGTALLSRLPLEDPANTLLPCFRGSEQRGLLEATVAVDGVQPCGSWAPTCSGTPRPNAPVRPRRSWPPSTTARPSCSVT